MDLHLKNKNIIVTGAAKGIGAAIASALSSEGAVPIILGRNDKDNNDKVKEIEKLGGKAFAYTVELSQEAEINKCVEKIKKDFVHIDGLINNAGVNDGIGLENGSYNGFIKSLHK